MKTKISQLGSPLERSELKNVNGGNISCNEICKADEKLCLILCDFTPTVSKPLCTLACSKVYSFCNSYC